MLWSANILEEDWIRNYFGRMKREENLLGGKGDVEIFKGREED